MRQVFWTLWFPRHCITGFVNRHSVILIIKFATIVSQCFFPMFCPVASPNPLVMGMDFGDFKSWFSFKETKIDVVSQPVIAWYDSKLVRNAGKEKYLSTMPWMFLSFEARLVTYRFTYYIKWRLFEAYLWVIKSFGLKINSFRVKRLIWDLKL